MSHPVPIERKVAAGNPGKRALPEPAASTVPAPVERPAAPAVLKEEGRALWNATWDYASTWLHAGVDVTVLTRYCSTWDEWHDLTATIEQEGRTTLGSQGQVVAHPAVAMLRAASKDMARMEGQLGLSPADRARIGLAILQATTEVSALDRIAAAMEGGTW